MLGRVPQERLAIVRGAGEHALRPVEIEAADRGGMQQGRAPGAASLAELPELNLVGHGDAQHARRARHEGGGHEGLVRLGGRAGGAAARVQWPEAVPALEVEPRQAAIPRRRGHDVLRSPGLALRLGEARGRVPQQVARLLGRGLRVVQALGRVLQVGLGCVPGLGRLLRQLRGHHGLGLEGGALALGLLRGLLGSLQLPPGGDYLVRIVVLIVSGGR
mmetsp:Transcript_70502/g.228320  ORF Transcript_70502/g.228320 Transcript_70502/m.228320 type:complete len:218 (+) Transcript_70502:662-1315(+)